LRENDRGMGFYPCRDFYLTGMKEKAENDGRTRSCGARRNECRRRRALKKKTAPMKPRDVGGPSGPRDLRAKQYESNGRAFAL
jgi:hypothetical protein